MEIILASKSPRRVELLSKYIDDFSVIPSDIKEKIDCNLLPELSVMTIAYEKGYEVAKKHSNQTVIAADTIVYSDKFLGKPEDRQSAFEMLKTLSGRSHKVITGIAIINIDKKIKVVDYDETTVDFRVLTDSFIEDYLDTGEYKDKAGGYAIQGKGEILADRINGSYSNIVGLPMYKLDKLFKQYFNKSLLSFK